VRVLVSSPLNIPFVSPVALHFCFALDISLDCKQSYSACDTELKKLPSVVLVRERIVPSDRRLSSTLVPTFVDRGVSSSQRDSDY
jgi:hypothetical protein